MSSAIPKAIRQQVWLQYNGQKFKSECYVRWCKNELSVFNYHVGHNIPRSKGGTLDLNNLKPICSNCNLSMGDRYTIDEWVQLGYRKVSCLPLCCLKRQIPELNNSLKQ